MHGHPDKVPISLSSGGDGRILLGGEWGKRREFDDHRTALPQWAQIDDLQERISRVDQAVAVSEGIERRRIQVGE
jgi:hypothetical protein